MSDLKTNYKNDVLDITMDGKRRYEQVENSDGTVSLVDKTVYTQLGDNLGADDINAQNTAINTLNNNLTASDNLKFKFATDGEGNYGYLKADDSFVPFKSGINWVLLGTSNSYDIKALYPNDYQKLTIDNFKYEVTGGSSSMNFKTHYSGDSGGIACTISAISLSYDNTTGLLSVSGGSGSNNFRGSSTRAWEISSNVTYKVYITV